MSIFDNYYDGGAMENTTPNWISNIEKSEIENERNMISLEMVEDLINVETHHVAFESTNNPEYGIALEKASNESNSKFKAFIKRIKEFFKKTYEFMKKKVSSFIRLVTNKKKDIAEDKVNEDTDSNNADDTTKQPMYLNAPTGKEQSTEPKKDTKTTTKTKPQSKPDEKKTEQGSTKPNKDTSDKKEIVYIDYVGKMIFDEYHKDREVVINVLENLKDLLKEIIDGKDGLDKYEISTRVNKMRKDLSKLSSKSYGHPVDEDFEESTRESVITTCVQLEKESEKLWGRKNSIYERFDSILKFSEMDRNSQTMQLLKQPLVFLMDIDKIHSNLLNSAISYNSAVLGKIGRKKK